MSNKIVEVGSEQINSFKHMKSLNKIDWLLKKKYQRVGKNKGSD